VYSGPVRFEVEVYRNEAGDWVATAVEHGVSATGRTENEALARIMEALAAHFKKS
jgi:predicted RNase H-like HicB family nuclease